MKILTVLKAKLFPAPRRLLAVFLACFATAAFADVNVTLEIWHGYDFYYPSVGLNASSPAPITYDRVESPNGLFWKNFGTNNDGNDFFLTNNLTALVDECNGSWKLYVNKGDASEQLYRFTVSITGVTTNSLGDVTVNYPADGSSGITNRPTFQWTGPTNFPFISVSGYFDGDNGNSYGDNLSGTATNWTPSGPLSAGPNVFLAEYYSNNVAGFTFTTPTNSSSGALLPGWTTQGNLYSYKFSFFSVVSNTVSGGTGGTGHTNLAYYSFEDNNLQAYDFSGHGNNLNYAWFTTPPVMVTNDAAAGMYAGGLLSGSGWFVPPTNLITLFAGSFTVSLWVKTTEVNGNDDDNQYSAAGICSALSGDYGTSTMPMGLTGSKLAFYTGGTPENILHSQASINTGQYVHLVVTRNQQTGEKRIYVNGMLDSSVFASTDLLDGAEPYGAAFGYNNGQVLTGEMDEIQLYSGVLSASDVLQLYNNPGTTIPDALGGTSDGLVAHYDFDGGTPLATDVSGNGNDLTIAGDFGGDGPATNSDHIGSSGGALAFDGGSYISAPPSLLSTLAGSFSISLWIKTTDNNGYPDAVGWTGDAIISADSPNFGANDLIPLTLTGGEAAFSTANSEFNYDDTINGSFVSDGQWHHIVVTRDQPTGEKTIYIDGAYNISDTDATNFLNDPKILTFGCKADASDPDQMSPSDTGSNGYDGLVDDIQIYGHALSPDDVAYLYAHPGATLATTVTNTPYPVDVELQFNISRIQENGSEYYVGNVSFSSVSPEATTTNAVYSPNGLYNTMTYPSGGSGSSTHSTTLAEVVDEFTNGTWKIYINQGSPTQQVYSFQGFASGIDTNLIKPILVIAPTNGAVNIATNAVFRWSGPSNFDSLGVDLLSGPAIFPATTTTNWSPTLQYGSDRFDLSYTSNSYTGFIFTTPTEDTTSTPVESWGYYEKLSSMAFTYFTVGAPAPLPVQLVNFAPTNGALRFAFQTLGGRPHTVQARTNLTLGTWVDLTNFTGDGSLQQFTFPVTNPPIRFFRVRTQ